MPKKRSERCCDCPECVESSGRSSGRTVPFTTYRSHQERRPFMKSRPPDRPRLPRVRLIVQPPVIQRKTTFTLTPVQEMCAVRARAEGSGSTEDGGEYMGESTSTSVGGNTSNGIPRGVDEVLASCVDPYEHTNSASDYGDLYLDAMDIDVLPVDQHASRPDSTDLESNDSLLEMLPQYDSDDSDLGEDRDEPFRFDVPDPPTPAHELFSSMPTKSFWKPFLLGVSYINLRFHSTHRACNLFLNIARIVLTRLGHFDETDKPISTLRSAFNTIGLHEPFLVLPMCPNCHRVFPSDSPIGLRCFKCSIQLFQTKSRLMTDFDGSDKKTDDLQCCPRLKCPFYPLTAQLPAFVCRFEEELENSLIVEPVDGVLRDARDGRVWKEARANDGSLFFSPAYDELRIGLILHFDGFGGERSRNGSNYSSGVLSYSVINLPVHLRYKPQNLLVVALSPGPRESTCDELQHLMEAVVDDKKRLYSEGITVKTQRYPAGRNVKVYCIADACDHPALCRVIGFADHSHLKLFCTRCRIPKSELSSIQGITGAYPARTGDEHRLLARQYRDAEPGEETGQREDLFKKNGTHYFAMSRLTYFDAVRMSAIDPMHNILLGVCKSQWLDSWVRRNVLRERTRRKTRELDQVHAYLSAFEMPSWVGRLPNQVGYPAGGSLSADEYKALVLVYCPIVIPLIWREWQPLAQAEYDKAINKWEANDRDPTKQSSEKPKLRMHPDDAENFLKLAASLKVILGRAIRLTDLDRAERLLKEYLEGYLTIHPMDVKPNHHWILHIFDQLRDFGPVYGFWTFTGERLNKVLKSFRTNNHNGGEIEMSFLRAFCKDITLRDTLRCLSSTPQGDQENDMGLTEVSELLSREEQDTRGTVASMNLVNQEVEERTRETILGFRQPSLSASVIRYLDKELQDLLLEYYQDAYPEANICPLSSRSRTGNHLVSSAKFFSYLIKDGRRITPSKSAEKAPNSIIQAEFDGQIFVGQVVSILKHFQIGVGHPTIFLHVLWFRRSEDIDTCIWDRYPELEVFFWKYNDSLRRDEPGPSRIITADRIKSQAGRATVLTRPPRSLEDEEEPVSRYLWVTIGLSRENITI